MKEILLRRPHLRLPGESLSGKRFVAAPDFKLQPGIGPAGWTPLGLVSIPAGSESSIDWKDFEIVGHSGLDPNHADPMISQAVGLHVEGVRDLHLQNGVFKSLPRVGILCAGVNGLEIEDCHSERTEGLLRADYFVTTPRAEPAINSGIHLHGHCTHRNGQGGGKSPGFESLLHEGEIGSSAINAYCVDSEFADLAAVGENKAVLKLAVPQRVHVRRCIGGAIMLQGSFYWNATDGPNTTISPGVEALFALGPKAIAADNWIEDCVLKHDLNLWRSRGMGNLIQLSYPQVRTHVRGGHLWVPRDAPYCAIQCAEGVDAEIRNVTFHGPAERALHMGDSAPAAWPSRTNPDWRTANQFVRE